MTLRCRHFLGIFLLFFSLVSCQQHDTLPHFPGSTLVFKKYYPENEILGMAADRQWREVRLSNSRVDAIQQWYEMTYAKLQRLDTHATSHCTSLSWQLPLQGNHDAQQLQVVICDHGNYRTLLTIAPQL
jgi:hypothetical protein